MSYNYFILIIYGYSKYGLVTNGCYAALKPIMPQCFKGKVCCKNFRQRMIDQLREHS